MKKQSLLSLFDRLSTDPKRNIDIIVTQAVDALDCTSGFYHWLNENEGVLQIRGGCNVPEDCEICTKPEGCICYETILNGDGKPTALEDLEATSFWETDPKIRKYRFKSYVGSPIPLNGKVCGCLDLFDVRKRTFLAEEMNLTMAMAKVLALEEERQCLQDAIEKKFALEKMFFEISSSGISADKIDSFLDKCVQAVGRTLDVGGVFVWLHDDETNSFSNVAEWLAPGIPSHKGDLQNIPADVFPWGTELLSQGETMNFEDIKNIPEGKEKEIMQMLGIKSILMIPFFISDTLLGALGIEVYERPCKWDKGEVEILQTISQIISRTIESYRDKKALQRANDELEENVNRRTHELQSTLRQLEKEHEQLLLREAKLQELTQELLETNKAITLLARNIKKERDVSRKRLGREVVMRVIPLIEDIRRSKNLEDRRLDLDMVTGYLREISAGMMDEQTAMIHLTRTEMRIASMISHGLTSPQIAARLNISPHTVKTHRKNIRKKLNIRNSGVEMRSHLEQLFGKETL